jgi:hypothetical protein
LPARQGHDLTILLPLRNGPDDLGVLALCGFADQNLTFDTETLVLVTALLAATLKRDGLITRRALRHLERPGCHQVRYHILSIVILETS